MLRALVLAALTVGAITAHGCDKGGPRACALDGDCRSGRNCWCDPEHRTPEGACGVVGKETKGVCLGDDAYQRRAAAEQARPAP